jgi:hypothetical protein
MGAVEVAKLCAALEQADLRNTNEAEGLAQELGKAFASAVEIFKSEREKRVAPVAA